MNKFWILLAFLFLAQCSFDTKSGFWTQDKKVKEANKNIIKIFKEEIITKKEFNTNLNLRIDISAPKPGLPSMSMALEKYITAKK